MVDEKAIGMVPLIAGITFSSMMLTRLFTVVNQAGWEWMTIFRPLVGVVGGVAAMIVGIGILLEWGGFDTSGELTDMGEITLGISAVVAFAFGGILAV